MSTYNNIYKPSVYLTTQWIGDGNYIMFWLEDGGEVGKCYYNKKTLTNKVHSAILWQGGGTISSVGHPVFRSVFGNENGSARRLHKYINWLFHQYDQDIKKVIDHVESITEERLQAELLLCQLAEEVR